MQSGRVMVCVPGSGSHLLGRVNHDCAEHLPYPAPKVYQQKNPCRNAEILKADSLVVDEVQVARIKKAWDETREYYVRRAKGEAADSDDPERSYAPQVFQNWINNKRTNTGRQAIESAFMMWGN